MRQRKGTKAKNLLDSLLKNPGTAMFVLGSGASASLGVPLARELREALIDRCGQGLTDILAKHGFGGSDQDQRKAVEGVPLEAVLSAYAEWAKDDMAPYLFLSSRLPTENASRDAPPSTTYEVLAHLMAHRVVNHVISLNWDELAERALDEELGPEGYYRVESLSAFQKLALSPIEGLPRRTVLKPHGTIGRPVTLRSDWEAVRRMEAPKSDALELVLRSIAEQPLKRGRRPLVVFIGTSFSEPDMQAFFRLAMVKKHIGESYFVNDAPLNDLNGEAKAMLECGFYGPGGQPSRNEWINNHYIQMTSDQFFQLVAEEMKGPASPEGHPARGYAGAQRHLIRLHLLGKERRLMTPTPANRLLLELLIFAVKVKGLFTVQALLQCNRLAVYAEQLAADQYGDGVENRPTALEVLETLASPNSSLLTREAAPGHLGDAVYYHEGSEDDFLTAVIGFIQSKCGNNLDTQPLRNRFEELLRDFDVDIVPKPAQTSFTFRHPQPVRDRNGFAELTRRIINSVGNGDTLQVVSETGEWLINQQPQDIQDKLGACPSNTFGAAMGV